MVTRSAGSESQRSSIDASAALPGLVCAKPKASATTSISPRTPMPMPASALRRVLMSRQPSECLSDTDIDLNRVVARPVCEGCCQVEADWTDQRVVAEPDAGAVEELQAVGQAVRVDVAAFDERGDADGVGDPVAQLQAEVDAGDAAQRHIARAQRAGALIGVTAHRSRPAGVESLVDGDFVARRAENRAKGGEACEHEPPAVVEPLVVALLDARVDEIEVGSRKAVIGDERQRLARAEGGIEEIVGGVAAQQERQPEQRVVLGPEDVRLHIGMLEGNAAIDGDRRQQRTLESEEGLLAQAAIGIGVLLEQCGVRQKLLVAMLPENLAARAEIGVVGDARADRARWALDQIDRHRHLPGPVRRIAMIDASGAEQAALDEA